MCVLLGLLESVFVVWVLCYIIFFIINYWEHISFAKRRLKYGYADYNCFCKEFNKITMEYSASWDVFKSNTQWDKYEVSYNAKYIKFNGISMIIRNPWDWLRVKLFLKKKKKEYDRGKLYKWQ